VVVCLDFVQRGGTEEKNVPATVEIFANELQWLLVRVVRFSFETDLLLILMDATWCSDLGDGCVLEVSG
jgi:hypothetical protein